MQMTQLPTLIAFAGQAGSGKDTAGQVAMRFMPNATRLSFAEPIKLAIKAMFGIDMNDDYWIERKEEVVEWIGKSPRQMMQTLGTEWGRDLVHTDIWVNRLDRYARMEAAVGQEYVIVPDYRFPNEGVYLRKQNAVIIHVHRPGHVIVNNGHVSETKMQVLDGEHLIVNDFPTREAFQREVQHLLSMIFDQRAAA